MKTDEKQIFETIKLITESTLEYWGLKEDKEIIIKTIYILCREYISKKEKENDEK